MTLPVVAIIGRPNVGKSTLFNCFSKSKKAIVSDIPGTTRDNIIEKVQGENVDYWMVDTAGLRNEKGEQLENAIQTQAQLATENADLVLFMIDGKAPLTAEDHDIIEKVRKQRTPLLFIANKIDDGRSDHLFEYMQFGFGEPLPISAKNYTGMWELEDAIEEKLTEKGFEKDEQSDEKSNTIKVALIGRPNVGKSTLFNQIIGQKRALVSDVAGTTRDSIDSEWTDESGQKYIFLDTAGLKRPGRIGKDIDFWSAVRSRKALENCHVAVLLIDALDGATHQDLALAGKIVESGKGLIVGVNKFDLAREKSRAGEETDDRELDEVKMWGEDLDKIRKDYWYYLNQKIAFIPWAPVLFFSGKTGKGVPTILETIKGVYAETHKRISTSALNSFVPDMYHSHVIPMVGTKKGTVKYATQVESAPPKFIFFVNNVKAFHFSYRRYVENRLREKFGFHGTPIKVEFRDSMESHEKRTRNKKK